MNCKMINGLFLRVWIVGLGVLLSLLLGGCSLSLSLAVATPPTQSGIISATDIPPFDSDLSHFNKGAIPRDIEPLTSGKGVIVCSPVIDSSTDSTTLGDGLSAWLQLYLAGIPQFGKTPSWYAVDRLPGELGHTDLRLTPEEAFMLHGITGITDVATATLNGKSPNYTLTFTLWDSLTEKPVCVPITITGDSNALLAQLPSLAIKMATQLGANGKTIPESIDLASDDIAFLGNIRFMSAISKSDQTRLTKLSASNGLAALENLAYVDSDSADSYTIPENNALKLEPNSPTVILECLWRGGFVPAGRVLSKRVVSDYPDNASANLAMSLVAKEDEDRKTQIDYVENAIACSPTDPETWLILSHAFDDLADDTRQARFTDEMTTDELKKVDKIYPYALGAAERAVQLDPKFVRAWGKLSESATFDDDQGEGMAASWNEYALDPNHEGWFRWALEMYQEKWFGDNARLVQVGNLLVANKAISPVVKIDIIYHFCPPTDSEFALKAVFAKQISPQIGALVAASPDDLILLKAWARSFLLSDDYKSAADPLSTLVQRDPSSDNHFLYGYSLHQLNRFPEAIAQFEAAKKTDPTYPGIDLQLGSTYMDNNDLEASKRELQEALLLDPESSDANYFIGIDNLREFKYSEAAPYFEKTIAIDPDYNNAVYDKVTYCLDTANLPAEAVKYAKLGLERKPDDTALMDNAADSYLKLNRPIDSLHYSHLALKTDPTDEYASENIAEAYVLQRNYDDACKIWRSLVSTSNNMSIVRTAQGFLAKYQTTH